MVKHFNKMLNKKPSSRERRRLLDKATAVRQQELTMGSPRGGSAGSRNGSRRGTPRGRSRVDPIHGVDQLPAEHEHGSSGDEGDNDDDLSTEASSYGDNLTAGLDKREQLELV